MPNRLAHETSPYLLQHAENPVAWYPWGHDAFEKARIEDKPIFLSIGYSTCHWCHVMAHESFEDPNVAAILNEHFVSIKVDREERPDVDHVYMTYVQALTGHGGWPLSAWLTTELKPFYGGTYFPPTERHGRPSFSQVLRSIAQAWRDDRKKLIDEGQRVLDALNTYHAEQLKSNSPAANDLEFAESGGEAFEKCFQYFYESFDTKDGGFGNAPKFPRASNLNFLFRLAAIQGLDTEAGTEAVKMATTTLRKMAEGGLHDHVGGGFHRYSVDAMWFVPHFEKMLYDQAQIAVNYLDAYRATNRDIYLWVARDVLDYVLRDLTDASTGAFYSAEDADSLIAHGTPEHAEGAFYVWSENDIRTALAVDRPDRAHLFDLVRVHFGVLPNGNVPTELDPQSEFTGKNILAQRHSILETAEKLQLDATIASDRLVEALGLMKQFRDARPRPHRDDKIITAWNGLMISALAQAGQVLRRRAIEQGSVEDETLAEGYLVAAKRAAHFVRLKLFEDGKGVLYRSFRGARGNVEAFAEDYACLIQGLLDLYEASFELDWLRWADRLQDELDARFWDEQGGGYFQSASGDTSIVLRLKDDYDGAEPAAGSIAAMNLWRLLPISRIPDARKEKARRTQESLRGTWARVPHALPQALCALEYALTDRPQIVIAGDATTPDFRALWSETQRGFGPRRTVLTLTSADVSASADWIQERAPWLAAIKPTGAALAYVCEHYSCRTPVANPSALRAQLA
jgi:hypothetical protein